MARASLNSTVTPTMINRVAAGFNRFFNQNGGRPETINQGWAEKLGIQNTSDAFFPTFTFGNAATQYQGKPVAQLGGGGVWPGANGSWAINDDLTWIKGAHSFHFGYQYTKYYYNERTYRLGRVPIQLGADGPCPVSRRRPAIPSRASCSGRSIEPAVTCRL